MKDSINFGIGFITGRPNVCRIINSYAKYLSEQVQDLDFKVNITVFVLFDLGYQFTTRTDFYGILPETYKYVNIKYITPEQIEEDKKILQSKYDLTEEDTNLFIGKGYGKARNAILYHALKKKIDYLLFWDDDEYPLAAMKKGSELFWKKQPTIREHIKNIKNADVTCGRRCGVMSPIPYIEYTKDFKEEDYKRFIDGISNEAIYWEAVQSTRKKDAFLGYADEKDVLNDETIKEISNGEKAPMILGSNLCLNLKHLDKIAAFYNPPNARGEDTFFSTALFEKGTKVLSIPVYHFHDGFLKFTRLMQGIYPKNPLKVNLEDASVEQRFYKACIGWMRYKPLYFYIVQRDEYSKIIKKSCDDLDKSVDKLSKQFETCDFRNLLPELDVYDKTVKTHYDEYVRVNEIWDKLKFNIATGKKI